MFNTDLLQQCNTVPQTPLQTSSVLKEQTEEEKEGLSLALREVREGFAHPHKSFVLKNPKLDSNSALAIRRKGKNSSSDASSLNSSTCDVKSIQENWCRRQIVIKKSFYGKYEMIFISIFSYSLTRAANAICYLYILFI